MTTTLLQIITVLAMCSMLLFCLIKLNVVHTQSQVEEYVVAAYEQGRTDLIIEVIE